MNLSSSGLTLRVSLAGQPAHRSWSVVTATMAFLVLLEREISHQYCAIITKP
jgi:hypothetical protein